MKKLALVPMIGLILSGCGGSGSDNSQSQPDVAPKAVLGTIDSVDVASKQIVVNDYHYDVAAVSYGDKPLNLGELKPNMMVQVTSGAKSGVQVQVEPTIVGKVTAVDHTTKTFTVNGIELTFAGLNNDIDVDDWVMVSSLPTATAGYKVLSVVEFEASLFDNIVEIEGRLSDLSANTFKLGAAINVDYSNAAVVLEGIQGLKNGQWVEVTGTMNGVTLNATEVELDDYADLGNDNEVEGVITWVANDQSSFELSYRSRFVVNAGTEFDDGNISNLKQGAVVEVKSITQNGQQIATEVEFDDGYTDNSQWREFEEKGLAQNINVAANSFIINGKTVVTDVHTEYDDRLTLDLLDQVGSIEVEGIVLSTVDENGQKALQYVAREIELDND